MIRAVRLLGRLWALLALVLALGWPGFATAQQDPARQLLVSINGARISDGLPPLALNGVLSTAAQRHSDDIAANGLIGSVGSDDSEPEERLLEAGFTPYGSGLVSAELVHVEENASMEWWRLSPDHQELVLSTQYREIGIGLSPSPAGDRIYWVVDLGAQPNRLPVFINYGASQTAEREVVLTLSNEGAVIYSEEPEVIGLANAVRVSNEPDLSGASWQFWSTEIEWLLPEGEGVRTVYVEFRDQEGRTALSQASILLLGPGASNLPATVTPVETVPPRPAPTSALVADLSEAGSGPAGVVPVEESEGPAIAAYASPQPVPIGRWFPSPAQDLLPLACGLQTLAAFLGFWIAVRRQRPPAARLDR